MPAMSLIQLLLPLALGEPALRATQIRWMAKTTVEREPTWDIEVEVRRLQNATLNTTSDEITTEQCLGRVWSGVSDSDVWKGNTERIYGWYRCMRLLWTWKHSRSACPLCGAFALHQCVNVTPHNETARRCSRPCVLWAWGSWVSASPGRHCCDWAAWRETSWAEVVRFGANMCQPSWCFTMFHRVFQYMSHYAEGSSSGPRLHDSCLLPPELADGCKFGLMSGRGTSGCELSLALGFCRSHRCPGNIFKDCNPTTVSWWQNF